MPSPRSQPINRAATLDGADRRRSVSKPLAIEYVLLASLIVLSIAAQLLWMDSTVGNYDEGLALFGADRVLRGDVPYRDFWTMYGPGGFYALAAVFRVFGETALAARGFDAAVKAAIVGLAFLIILRFGRKAIATAGALLVLGLLIYLRNYGVPLFAALCAALGAVLALQVGVERADWRGAALAGAAVGIAAVFRQDLGAYALIGCAAYLGRIQLRADRAATRRHIMPLVIAFGGALLLVAGSVLIALIRAVPLHDLYRDLVAIPLRVYPEVRALPFPPLVATVLESLQRRSLAGLGPLVVYLPFAVTAACVGLELLRIRRPNSSAAPDSTVPLFQLLILLNILFIAKGLVRVSPFQMGAALVVSAILVAAAAARMRSAAWRTTLSVVVAVGCALLLAKPFITAAQRGAEGASPGQASVLSDRWASHARELCRDHTVPRLRCLRLDANRMAVARYLLAHGGPGQRIYFGLGRHDKIFASDMALYFAAEAIAPTKWHDLHPGVQTTLAVQTEMVAEFEARPLAYAVIDTEWDDRQEPNASARSSGVTLLDRYLRSHFHPVFHAGPLTVLAPDRTRPPS